MEEVEVRNKKKLRKIKEMVGGLDRRLERGNEKKEMTKA